MPYIHSQIIKRMKAKLIAIIIAALFLYSCKTKEHHTLITASHESMIDMAAGSCPYLTKDNNNNVVLSWIKKVGSTSSIFCYALSHDDGKTFGAVVEVPGSTNVHPHGENMPKIIFKPSGEIIAVWGAANPNPKNAYSGLVYYTQSFDEGKTWTKPTSLTQDTASYDQRYFDVALLPNGEAAIVWLDNRKTSDKEGSGLYYAATNGRNGFKDERLISEPCCQCCRTDLYVDRNKNIHVLYRAIINNSIRDMVHILSKDAGKTFSPPQRISKDDWVINGCPHTGPAMTENKQGIHFTWFTGGNNPGIYYSCSKDNGASFTERDSVSGKASKHCQITCLPNDDLLIVWNESFAVGKAYGSRIGIEERTANGSATTKQYITSAGSNSSFPVIYPLAANKALVAYTETANNVEHVLYKQVTLQ